MECSNKTCHREVIDGFKTCKICRLVNKKYRDSNVSQGLCSYGCGNLFDDQFKCYGRKVI